MTEYNNASTPIECYEFFVSDYGYFRLTSADEHVTAESKSYTSTPGLKRSSLSCNVVTDSQAFEIEIPAASALAQAVALFETPKRVIVAFRRYHRDNLSTPTMRYNAIMNGASIAGETAKLKFTDSFNNVAANNLPKTATQGLCNWTLGDINCKVFTGNMQVTFTSARKLEERKLKVEFSGMWGAPPFKTTQAWQGATVTATRNGQTENRQIRFFTPDDGIETNFSGLMSLSSQFSIPIDDNTTVSISKLHCEGNVYACSGFDNIARFGGFIYMPTEKQNPFQTRIDLTRKK